MEKPPTIIQTKDASWHEMVTLVLGPPRKLDFQEKAKQRAQRRRIEFLTVVPSDDQCRFLWKFHASCHSINKVAAAENPDDIKSISSSEKLKDEAMVTIPLKKSQTRNDRSAKRKLVNSNRVSLSPSRKRPKPCPPSSPGWITKSSFYSDETKSYRKNQDVDFPDEVGIQKDKSTTKRGRTRHVDSPKKKLYKCDCKTFDTNDSQSPNKNQQVIQDDSLVDLDSPEEKLSAKRTMTMLFRPSVRRANSRLKQSSILHLFGKK